MARIILVVALILLTRLSGSGAGEPVTQPAALDFTVLCPDGRPAAGAKAVFVPPERVLEVSDGRSFDPDPNYTLATADSAGRVSLPRATASGPFAVCVIHDSGEADFTEADLPAGDLRLAAWGSVSGVAKYGPNVLAGQQVFIQTARPLRPAQVADSHPPRIGFSSLVTASADGHYVADRVPTGESWVRVSRKIPGMPWPLPGRTAVIDVTAGESKIVNLGGQGRAVVGKIEVPTDLAKPGMYSFDSVQVMPAFSAMPPSPERPAKMSLEQYKQWAERPEVVAARARITDWEIATGKQAQGARQECPIQPDGTFRAEDVMPGDYRLFVRIGMPRMADGRSNYLAEAEITCTVPPPPDASKPIDIGRMVAKPQTSVGKTAFAFDVADLNGGRVRLTDYRGKFVLVNFWATWCGPCVAEIPNLKVVSAKFGHDPRFAMITLSCDDMPERPTALAEKEKLAWSQGFLGGTDDPVQAAYGVGAWPNIFLIGPDGTIVGECLRGDRIEQTIAEKLNGVQK